MAGNNKSGRRPDWFRERCAEILEEYELVEFVGKVAAGQETDNRLLRSGEIVQLPVSIHDRLDAFKMLAEWGVGKPIQYVATNNMTPADSVRNAQQIFDMIQDLETGKLAVAVSTNGSNGNH